jgi:hypothetical protein
MQYILTKVSPSAPCTEMGAEQIDLKKTKKKKKRKQEKGLRVALFYRDGRRGDPMD